MDYKNGKIYTIRSHQTDKIYIGSTTTLLSKRLSAHKRHFRAYLDGKNHKVTSLEIIKYGDAYIELLEAYPCDNKMMLLKREGECIRKEPNCVNRCIAGRTRKEYYDENAEKIIAQQKEYQNKNADRVKEYHKEYYEQNADKLKAQQKLYYEQNADKKKQYQNKYRELKKMEEKQNADKIKEYREQNAEKIKEYQNKYRELKENILT